VEAEVASTRFDRLAHLAGSAFVGEADWRRFYAVNQLGTCNLLDAVARVRPGVRCVLASSAQVYGPGAQGLISETFPANPTNHYAISKHAMELGAQLWRAKLAIVIARPFNYTGIGQDIGYLLPKLVDHFQRRAAVVELGNTWIRRDFGDVRAVADAYAGLLLADDTPPVINICTGAVRSVDEVIATLRDLSGHSIEVRVNPAFVRTQEVPVLGGDATQLRQTLPDWRPLPLEDTLGWMYADGGGW
jgi:nucleoside-diphosphate-sugar epimerase